MVADEIKEAIIERRFQPHEKLPSETELASILDVGRPTVREALRVLEGQGWVTIRYAEGAYVADRDMILGNHIALKNKGRLLELLRLELEQLREEGASVTESIGSELERLEMEGSAEEVDAFYRSLDGVEHQAEYAFDEPADWHEPGSTWSASHERLAQPDQTLYRERISGAWLGKCIGSVMGRPFCGWHRNAIVSYLSAHSALPLEDYVPGSPETFEQHGYTWQTSGVGVERLLRGRVSGVPEDYPLNLSLLNIKTVAEMGYDFTVRGIAHQWLVCLPFKTVYNAERSAYEDLIMEWLPPATARRYNPYREWSGAMIRADAFGLLAPGDHELAARMASRDAFLSHTKNGRYAAELVAALVAAVLGGASIGQSIEIAQTYIPERSRLASAIRTILEARDSGSDVSEALDRLQEKFSDYPWLHSVINAGIIVAALVYGDGDFTKSVSIAATAGADTDGNAVVVGTILGALVGASGVPEKLFAPLEDRIESLIPGYSDCAISCIAEMCTQIVNQRQPERATFGWYRHNNDE